MFLAIIAFYSIPYTKCNSLILSANKNETGFSFENENDPFISKSDFDKLVVLPEDETDEDTYVKIRSTKKLSFSAINKQYFNGVNLRIAEIFIAAKKVF